MVNKAELRQFITQYFSDLELNELCFDYYPDLLNQFTSGMTKSQKVIALLGYCDRRGLTNHLLTTLAKLRAAAYQDQFGLVPKQQASAQTAGRNPNQIFLSHANQDAEFARGLAEDLRRNGFQAFRKVLFYIINRNNQADVRDYSFHPSGSSFPVKLGCSYQASSFFSPPAFFPSREKGAVHRITR